MNKLLYRNNPSHIIVIDIGGTSFRSALFNTESMFLESQQKTATPNFIQNPKLPIAELQKLLIKKIISTVKDYQVTNKHLNCVGLSFPAPITIDGVVTQASTLWGSKGKNYHLLKHLSRELPDINWTIANDITAAIERYASIKKYKKIDYLAVITISSGIGSKIYDVKNSTVILDKKSIGGEMGHIKINFSKDAPICDCGGKGHLAAFSSGRAIERTAITNAKKNPKKYQKSYLYKIANLPENINNESIILAIKNKDQYSLEILDQTTFPLACSISHVSGIIGVGKFIIIGGFAINCGEPYIESLRNNLLKMDFYGRIKNEITNLVELGINDDNDPLVGIGLLSKKRYLQNG